MKTLITLTPVPTEAASGSGPQVVDYRRALQYIGGPGLEDGRL